MRVWNASLPDWAAEDTIDKRKAMDSNKITDNKKNEIHRFFTTALK